MSAIIDDMIYLGTRCLLSLVCCGFHINTSEVVWMRGHELVTQMKDILRAAQKDPKVLAQ
jgi:hypothetical protein